MIKNFSGYEETIDGKVYRFLCDMDSSLGAVHDALRKMLGQTVDTINKVVEAEKAKQEKAIEPDKVE